jgi:hypothetical protein
MVERQEESTTGASAATGRKVVFYSGRLWLATVSLCLRIFSRGTVRRCDRIVCLTKNYSNNDCGPATTPVGRLGRRMIRIARKVVLFGFQSQSCASLVC